MIVIYYPMIVAYFNKNNDRLIPQFLDWYYVNTAKSSNAVKVFKRQWQKSCRILISVIIIQICYFIIVQV